MAEEASTGRPRIALVYGDPAGAAHLRDALAANLEIVYENAAAAFDVDRLAGLHVAAALVNLDGGDWLEPLAGRLEATGVRLVFNDATISRSLEGWARARWLRHLTAKLAGSSDYDPPRPDVAPAAADEPPAAGAVGPLDVVPAPDAAARPLSPDEIASMTANFVVVPDAGPASAVVVDAEDAAQPTASVASRHDESAETFAASARAGAASEDPDGRDAAHPGAVAPEDAAGAAPPATVTMALRKEEDMVESWEGAPGGAPDAKPRPVPGIAEAAQQEPAPEALVSVVPATSGGGSDELLEMDPDTAALSALIDSQLAESAARAPVESPEVWSVSEGGTVSPVALGEIEAPADDTAAATTAAAGETAVAARPHRVSDPVDDAEVLKGLPSLDDWQLVDPGAPDTPAPKVPQDKDAIAATSIDIAGLELVPMEEQGAGSERHSDPIERWMDTAERARAEAQRKRRPANDGGGA